VIDREELTAVKSIAVDTVRVTPLDEAGTPDHPWAMTYEFRTPVLFCVAIAELPGGWPGEALRYRPHRYVGAIVAEYEHEQSRDIQALAQGLWQRRRSGAAVEGWTLMDPGIWWYGLMPWWRHCPDTDRWPIKDTDEDRAYAVGNLRGVDGYPWPTPSPLTDTYSPYSGTQMIVAQTREPPPPAGLAPFTPAAS
jgi:hypothetical protein